MKTIFACFLFALIAHPLLAQNRKALLIGANSYEFVPLLANPVNDVNRLSKGLSKHGFVPTTVTNPTGKEISSAIGEFVKALGDDDIAVIYFAGHGVQLRGQNHLLGIDGKPDQDAILNTVSLQSILTQLSKGSPKIYALILDCCRNPLPGKSGLAPILDVPNKTIVAFSTAANEIALDGEGKNSPYAEALSNALLAKPLSSGLSLQGVLSNAGKLLSLRTKDRQKPAIYNQALGVDPVYLVEPRADNGNDPALLKIQPQPLGDQFRGVAELKPQKAGVVTAAITGVTQKGHTVEISWEAKAQQRTSLQVSGIVAYDSTGRRYSEGKTFYFSERYNQERSIANSSFVSWELEPEMVKKHRTVIEGTPKDLPGLSLFHIGLSVDRKPFRVQFRHLGANGKVAPQAKAVPLSRLSRVGKLTAGIRSIERSANGLAVDLVLESDADANLSVTRFRGYDELGRIFSKGSFTLERRPNQNDYRFNLPLTAKQSRSIRLDLDGVEQDCAGLTLLSLELSYNKAPLTLKFYDLAVDESRSEPSGEPIPTLLWKLPQTRIPQKLPGVEIALRQASSSNGQAALDFILLSEKATSFELTKTFAYSPLGDLHTSGSFELGGYRWQAAHRQTLNVPAAQPIALTLILDKLPNDLKGLTELRFLCSIGGTRSWIRMKDIRLSPDAPRSASGLLTWKPQVSRENKVIDGIRMDLLSFRHEGANLVTEFLLMPNDRDRSLQFGPVAVSSGKASFHKGQLSWGAYRTAMSKTRFGNFFTLLPQAVPLRMKLQLETQNQNLAGIDQLTLKARDTDSGEVLTLEFRDIPLPFDGLGQKKPSRLDQLRNR